MFYATDAHWNGYGALASFNCFAEKGLPECIPLGNMNIDDGLFHFNGGGSRAGLVLLTKEVNEPALAMSDFIVDEGPDAYVLSSNGDSIAPSLYNEYNFYSAWYEGYGFSHSIALEDSEKKDAPV